MKNDPPKIDPTVTTVHRPRGPKQPKPEKPRGANDTASSSPPFIKKLFLSCLYVLAGVVTIACVRYWVFMTPQQRAQVAKEVAAEEAKQKAEETRRQAQEAERKAQEQRLEEKRQVQEWIDGYGVRYSCEQQLKRQLRDPDSYQSNDDWREIRDQYGGKILTWGFRSKNGFGGYNLATGTCIATTKDGGTVRAEILEVP
jgi:predicted Fe-S protein YdhL (DUF1289 family)